VRLAVFEHRERAGRRVAVPLESGPQAGALVDLNRALALRSEAEDAGAPDVEADSLLPSDPAALLRRGPPALDEARRALAWVEEHLARDGPGALLRAGALVRRGEYALHAPVPRPGKIVGVARNYAAHAREQGQSRPPEEPVLFLKAPSAVIGPEEDVVLPAACREVDYEGELAVVIGRRAREVDESEALACVAGYTVANDVSARDYQDVRGQRFIGKSCDTFAPLGPVLVTADEIPDPQDLGLRTVLSGEVVQSARTKEMLFPVARLIAFVSRLMTLEPADVLLTGTPAGVGKARRPQRWLRDGDLVEVHVERIGTLRNRVRAANAP
jgi:2-keto-4-pentenoate hydratase/2-oxohepta-3-ene-1,7-dioic acid hydratase in catechol pathway